MMAVIIEEDVLIDLVGKDADIIAAPGADHPGDLLELFRGGDPSRRIGGKVEEDQLGSLRKDGRQFLAGKGKGVLLFQMDGDRRSAHIGDEGFIDGKTGAGIDHLVPRTAVGLLAKADGGLAPRKDDDALRLRPDPPRFASLSRDGRPEGRDPLGITVMGVIEVDLAFDLLLDESGDRKIRLTQIALDDLPSLRLQRTDIRSYLERILAVDTPCPVRIQPHDCLPIHS